MPRISAVIPTWNRAGLLAAVLSDLRRQTLPLDELIVADNGSTDETHRVALELGAELIAFPENRGFAAAVNAGIRRSTGDWILIVNNDVLLPPDWLQLLHASAELHQAAFAVGKLLQPGTPPRLDGSWDLLCRGAHAWRCGFGRPDAPPWSEPRQIDFAPMTAALFHRRVFTAVGYLDESFEAYYEDVDFGLRCAMAGLTGIYEPAAAATHTSKTTLGRKSARVYFLTARNQIFLLAKHYPNASLRRFAWPIVVAQLLSFLGAMQQRQPVAALHGLYAGFRLWSSRRGQLLDRNALEQALTRSERQIRDLQSSLGFDSYWRIYFSLVR